MVRNSTITQRGVHFSAFALFAAHWSMSKYSAGFRLPLAASPFSPVHGSSGGYNLQGVHIFSFLHQPLLKELTPLLQVDGSPKGFLLALKQAKGIDEEVRLLWTSTWARALWSEAQTFG